MNHRLELSTQFYSFFFSTTKTEPPSNSTRYTGTTIYVVDKTKEICVGRVKERLLELIRTKEKDAGVNEKKLTHVYKLRQLLKELDALQINS